MKTVKIVCPECNATNSIEESRDKESYPCTSCGALLEETKPLECSDESCRVHIKDSDIPLIIDFYSPACAPCMKMAPDFEAAAKEFALKVRFLKVNVLHHQEVARAYGVNQLPAIIAFKGGKEQNHIATALSKEQLSAWAQSLL